MRATGFGLSVPRVRSVGAGGDRKAAVVARSLRKLYGDRVAVDGIDFEVQPATCFGFLGPNGAGKTTTMKMIYGLATVGGGDLRVLGLDARTQRRAIKARLGVVPQETNLDGEVTVLENLLVQASYFGIGREAAEARARELLDFPSCATARATGSRRSRAE